MPLDDLLVPRHPQPRLHEQQVQALQQLPETERAAHAQLLRLGNAAYCYHQRAEATSPKLIFSIGWPGYRPGCARR